MSVATFCGRIFTVLRLSPINADFGGIVMGLSSTYVPDATRTDILPPNAAAAVIAALMVRNGVFKPPLFESLPFLAT